MPICFKLDMLPPRTTSQQKGERIVGKGKNAYIHHYQKAKVKSAQNEYIARLLPHRPKEPIKGPVRMTVKFLFKANTKNVSGMTYTHMCDEDVTLGNVAFKRSTYWLSANGVTIKQYVYAKSFDKYMAVIAVTATNKSVDTLEAMFS